MEINTPKWHLDMLVKAITKVEETYLKSEYFDYHTMSKDGDLNNEEILMLNLVERVFAYELYRQWANLLEPYKTGFIVNGEPSKIFTNDIIKLSYPDLILHKDKVENMIVCEIKRKENISGSIDDIKKLNKLLSEDLVPKHKEITWNSYKYGVFLLVGTEPSNKLRENLKGLITKSKKELLCEKSPQKWDRIYCIVYDGVDKNIKLETLKDILEEKNN